MWGDVPRDELVATWREYLAGFTGDDLRSAVEAMARSYVDFPPTLPQFVNLCRDARSRRTQTTVALPGPREPVPERVAAAVSGIGAVDRKDCKAWARKILDGVSKGVFYPAMSVVCAKDALGEQT